MSNFDISISVSWQGRLRRRTFWCTFLMIAVIGVVVSALLGEGSGGDVVLGLLILPFELSLIVRRAQDAGLKDGIKYFLVGAHILIFILSMSIDEDSALNVAGLALIYMGALIIFLCKDSEPGSNKWGPNPKEVDAPTAQVKSGSSPTPVAARDDAEQAVAQAKSDSNPKQVCPICSGSGKNAVGYVCPVCGGSGFIS